MAETVRIKIETNGGEQLAENIQNAADASQSLKAQLREITQELQGLEPGSARFQELAQRAGQLRDTIQDTNAVINATAGAPIENLGKGLQGVATIGLNGFQGIQGAMQAFGAKGEALQEGMAKLQGIMAMTQAIESFGSLKDQITNLKAGFTAFTNSAKVGLQGVKGAVAATGIGLLVIAVGVLVAYWDDIKGLVSGVSAEQEALNAKAQKNVEIEEQKTKRLKASDNILRLQGYSEKQILEMKAAQVGKEITALEVKIKQAKITLESQIDAEKRNYEITKGIIIFLTLPLQMILGTIDAVTEGLAAIGIMDKALTLRDDMTSYFASFLFDPKAVEEEGKKTITEMEDKLLDLKNEQAGYQLEIQKIEKQGQEDRNKVNNQGNQNRNDDNKSAAEKELAEKRILEDAKVDLMAESKEKDLEENRLKYERLVEDAKKGETKISKQTQELIDTYNKQKEKADQETADKWKKIQEDKVKAAKDAEEKLVQDMKNADAASRKADTEMRDAKIALMEEGFAKEKAVREAAYQDELYELQNQLDDEKITREQYDQLTKDATQKRNDEIAAINKKSAEEEAAAAKELRDQKIQAVSDTISTISNLAQLFAGKSEKEQRRAFTIQKGAQIAQATIDTYKSATGAYSSLSSIPVVGPVLGAAAAAAAITAGLLNIKKIASTEFKAEGGGGDSGAPAPPAVPDVSAGAMSAPTPPSLTIEGSAMGGSEGSGLQLYGQRQKSTRSYVVESDITDTQNRLNTYKQRSEIG
jgi:hypothetical protein